MSANDSLSVTHMTVWLVQQYLDCSLYWRQDQYVAQMTMALQIALQCIKNPFRSCVEGVYCGVDCIGHLDRSGLLIGFDLLE